MKGKQGQRMVKKQLLILNTTVLLGLGSVFALPAAQAESKASIQAKIVEKNKEISSVQNELARLNEQIQRAEQAIIDNENMIAKTERDIAAANQEIQKLEEEIASLKEAIAKRKNILKERARSYQETGGSVQYVDVLLGANSFGDFVDRVEAVATIIQADKDLMEKHEADMKAVEEKQAAVKKKLEDLNSMKVELEGMRGQLLEQKQQNDQLKAELKQKEAAGLAEKASLERSLAQQQAPAVVGGGGGNAKVAAAGGFAPSVAVSPSASASEKIRIVTTVGNRYIGNSVYVFGGGRTAYDVANGRFDCSGFVHWAFAQAGISVGTSTDSLKNAGRSVSTSEMRPGDLVFFNTYKADGHVGIYLGGGKFIGSQSSTGVAIANMSSGYWADTFNGRVVRIIE
jgi:peptidoglycan hydrolase CwlO-like protein